MYKLLIFTLFLSVIFSSCNPFSQNRVLKNQDKLLEIVEYLSDYENVVIDCDSENILPILRSQKQKDCGSDDFLHEMMKKNQIDLVYKNSILQSREFIGFANDSDSLFIFVQRSSSMFDTEKRIIYDYAATPRSFGDHDIPNAAYRRVQLDPRWYFSEEGFD